MKVLKLLIIILTFLLPAYSYSQDLGELRISLISGDVQIRSEDTEDWVPASINMPLRQGDRLWVPEGGKSELQLRDGTSLRVDQQSALEILTLDKDSSQFYLNEGHVYANFRGQGGSLLQMDTPVSSTRAYDRSIFKIDISDDGLNQVSVLKGSVDVESNSGRTTVKSGYTLSLNEETYAELSPLGPPDEWERWNSERDKRLAEWRPPARYLPEELYAYSRDFEEYGRWVYASGYGYVWTPRVVVSVGWAPYRIGRWVWVGGDYVWISYEPWGWVPYHYGRWAFVGSIGWCWVPPVRGAVFWGPGFVAWVRTPTYVAWVPLGPREIYYGHGHYGPYSVNVTNVNVTNIHVNRTAYKNIQVNNAVTVVHHDTFVKGTHVDVKVRENPFLKEKISVVGPDIKHERATVMPVIKEVPQSKRPPELIREIKVREIKEKRPLVKEREASVLRPQSPPKEMTLKVKEGKPVQREFERANEPRLPQREVEKSREIKPSEKKVEKPKSVEKGREKPPEAKPPEKGVEKTKELTPVEKRMERPQESKPPEGRTEKPKGAEKAKEIKPTERTIGKTPETKQDTKGLEKSREMKAPERTFEKTGPTEKKIDKPQESKTQSKSPEKGVEKPKENKAPERVIERPREIKPAEKRVEKPKESKPPERAIEKPREVKPSEGVSRPRETAPQERGVEKPKEPKQPERKIDTPRESRPPERGIERSKPPEVEKEKPTEPRSMERRQEGPRAFKQG
jgi:Family of unknown function (DUF6600)/FecR protein